MPLAATASNEPVQERHDSKASTPPIDSEEDTQSTPKTSASGAPLHVPVVLELRPNQSGTSKPATMPTISQPTLDTTGQSSIKHSNEAPKPPSQPPSFAAPSQPKQSTSRATTGASSLMSPPIPRPTPQPSHFVPTSFVHRPLFIGPSLVPPPLAAASQRGSPITSTRQINSTPASIPVTPKKRSKKVVLEPDSSPLDWAALAANPKNQLRGANVPPGLLHVTPSMLKEHHGRKGRDAWTSYCGKVYNISPYAPYHPGGKGELLRGAGKDSGQLFQEIHPWVNWEGILGECFVGILVSENNLQAENTSDAWGIGTLKNEQWLKDDLKLRLDNIDVNSSDKDEYGRTPLSRAAMNGNQAIVKMLLDTGKADVDSKDNDGRTPLSWAAENGNQDIVKMLLDTGKADVDSRGNDDRTRLSRAAKNGNQTLFKMIFEISKADVDSKDNYGRTPLSWAAENGNQAIVKMLLDTGKADVDSRGNDGRTPLSWAAENGNQAIVKMLLDTGKADVDSKDNDDRTPLSWAAENENQAIVKMLFDSGSSTHLASTTTGKHFPKAPGGPIHEHTSELAPTSNSRSRVREKLCRKMYGLLSDVGLREESIPQLHQRFRWMNRNGKESFDDYIEHEPGAIQALQEYLDTSIYRPKTASEGGRSRTFSPLSLFQNPNATSSSRRHTSVSGDIADQSLEIPSTAKSSVSQNDIELGHQSSQTLYLLSCTKRRRQPVKLHQEVITDIMDDRQLFHILRRIYRGYKTPFESYWSLQSIQNIHFMKFTYAGYPYIDIRCHSEICENGKPCNCIPPAVLVPPMGVEYECRPIPSKLSPPVGPRLMMDLFSDPDSIRPGSAMILQQLPKKMRGELCSDPIEPIEAWGIYYEEGWDWSKIWLVLAIGFFPPSLLFGILWGILKKDIQGAFGVASWWMTGATIFLGVVGTCTSTL